MTATTPSRTISTQARPGASQGTSWRPFAGAILVAFAVSALSLVFNHAIDYDPEGWIVYAREAFGPLALNTTGFPAWKPLPVILIGPFTLITRGHADVYYWLLITRACAVLTVFGAAALAHRFAGRLAALLAAVFVVLAPYWLLDSTIGDDSAVSGALMTSALLAHYRGRYRWTVVALTGIALLRPEAAPLLLVYGVWMWRTRRMSWWFPLGALLFIVVMWLIPTILHAGLSPVSISQNSGGANTAVNTSFPALSVIKEAAQQAHEVPAVLALIAIATTAYGLIRRRSNWLSRLWGRSTDERVMLIAGILWVLIVAAETEKGFSGNNRYLVPGVVLLLVIAAVVAVRIASSNRIAATALALACVAATAVLAVHPLNSALHRIQQRQSQATAMAQEAEMIKCPPGSHLEANDQNNAYLAEIIGAPLQDTINWHLPGTPGAPGVYFRGGSFWFVYCSP